MRPVECANKHFFDADKYAECPHCAEMRLTGTIPLQPQNTEKKVSFLDRLSKRSKKKDSGEPAKKRPVPLAENTWNPASANNGEEDSLDQTMMMLPDEATDEMGAPNDGEHTMMLFSEDVDSENAASFDDEHTMILLPEDFAEEEPASFDDDHTMMMFPEDLAEEEPVSFDDSHTMMMFPEDLEADDDAAFDDERAASVQQVDSFDAIQSGDYYEGKMGRQPQALSRSQMAETARISSDLDDTKTVCFFNLEGQDDPVVGWLVCLTGSHQGESFSLKSGRNNIGRASNMDVSLPSERSISRDRHAVLTYEPIHREFIIQAGESNGLTYLNQELVVTFKQLHDRDKLVLGQASFLFVALCGEDFSWDEYIIKNEAAE